MKIFWPKKKKMFLKALYFDFSCMLVSPIGTGHLPFFPQIKCFFFSFFSQRKPHEFLTLNKFNNHSQALPSKRQKIGNREWKKTLSNNAMT